MPFIATLGTRGGNWQVPCQVVAGRDGSGSERDRPTSACCSPQPTSGTRAVCAVSPVGHLLEGDLADGNSSDKFLPSYCTYSVAATQARKDIF